MPAVTQTKLSPRLIPLPRLRRKNRIRNMHVVSAAVDSVVTQEMLDVAQQVADAAAAVTTPLFRAKLSIDIKDDKSPVTEADKEAEACMRSIIQERLPTHAMFGEELGFSQGVGAQRVLYSQETRSCPSAIMVSDSMPTPDTFTTDAITIDSLTRRLRARCTRDA
jgi:hypothetical protein